VDDLRYLTVAACIASQRSHDDSTNNGAVIVAGGEVIAAANEYLDNQWRSRVATREDKLTLIEHAERGAVYTAAEQGICTRGATMYCIWAACPECARAIVAGGITRLVTLQATRDLTPERWAEPIRIADRMLAEAGVSVEFFPGRLNVQIRFNGQFVTI